MPTFLDRLQHAWNAFSNPIVNNYTYGQQSSYRPDRMRFSRGNERSIITSIYNRLSIDIASLTIQHVRLDEQGRYLRPMDSHLNECLTLDTNLDQTSRAFFQDVVMSLFDEGCCAIVPIMTTEDPLKTGSFDIGSMRVGKIIEWMPKHVQVEVYNENSGRKEQLILPKRVVAIIENPFYSVMNEHNSTMQRLIRKLNLLDAIDEESGSGKLDLIIQLPYVVKNELKRQQAETRRKDIEMQLSGSKYGIAYTDGTEKITQLNRPVDNNLMSQIEYLTSMLYGQLGVTPDILNGTATADTMANYYTRTVEVVVSVIVDEMKRKFLTKTARSQGQSIMFFRDPFKLAPVEKIADMADKFTRNEILSSNELREKIGMIPSSDPKADELRNKNISVSPEESFASTNNANKETNGGANSE